MNEVTQEGRKKKKGRKPRKFRNYRKHFVNCNQQIVSEHVPSPPIEQWSSGEVVADIFLRLSHWTLWGLGDKHKVAVMQSNKNMGY